MTRPTVLLAVVLLAVAGCSGQDVDVSRTPLPASTAQPTSDEAPLRFSEPLWEETAASGQRGVLEEVTDLELAGDTLLYTGEDDSGDGRLVAADVDSGKQRWSLRSGEALGSGAGKAGFSGLLSVPAVVRYQDSWVVLLGYEKGHEEGVAALSVKDGSVRWKIRVLADNGRGGDTRTQEWQTTYIDAVDEKTLLVDVTTFKPDDTTVSSTVAYDLGSRKERWRAPGVDPWTVHGDTVYGEKPTGGDSADENDRGEDDAVVVALDTRTGKKKWDLAKEYPTSHVRRVGDEIVVVAVEDGTVFLDPGSGKKLAHLGKDVHWCGDDADFVACGMGEENAQDIVTARRTGDTVELTQLLDTRGGQLRRVLKRWLVVSHYTGQFQYSLLDRTGRKVGGTLPGGIGAIDDRYVVFYQGRLEPGFDVSFSVHRLR